MEIAIGLKIIKNAISIASSTISIKLLTLTKNHPLNTFSPSLSITLPPIIYINLIYSLPPGLPMSVTLSDSAVNVSLIPTYHIPLKTPSFHGRSKKHTQSTP